jgi:hypothetical protein
MVRSSLLVIFAVVAAALVAGCGCEEQQPGGGGGQEEGDGEAGGSAGKWGERGLRVRRILGRDRQLGRLQRGAGVVRGVHRERQAPGERARAAGGGDHDAGRADALELIGWAEEEFKEAALGVNGESRQWGAACSKVPRPRCFSAPQGR